MFHKRLVALRNQSGLSQEELAKRLNMTRGQLSMYEIGKRKPDMDTVKHIASYFDVSTDYLITGEERQSSVINAKIGSGKTQFIERLLMQKRRADLEESAEVIHIPVLGFIKAGYDLYADQQVIDYERIDKRTVADGEYFYLIVRGDSMIDANIKEGMRVLVRRQDFVEDGKIGVVIINGDEGTLKKITYDGDTVILTSANIAYKPRVLPLKEISIIGQAVKYEGDL